MWPFKPAWQSKNQIRAVKAVRKITDQNQLAHIALNGSVRVGEAAVEKLTNPDLLADVARNAKKNKAGFEVGIAAVKKLKDQTMLYNIAKSSELHSSVRRAASALLTNKKLMHDIAKNAIDIDECFFTIRNLTDIEALTDIARNGKLNRIRASAAEQIGDDAFIQEIYSDIAINGDSSDPDLYYLLRSIVEKLTNQTALIHLARNSFTEIRLSAAYRLALTDNVIAQEAYEDIAKNKENKKHQRNLAISYMTDQKALKEIMDAEETGNVYEYEEWSDWHGMVTKITLDLRDEARKRLEELGIK